MSLASVRRAEESLLLPTYDRYPLLLKRGKGVYLYDDRGRRYLDFLSGIGVNALGHAHPAVLRTLRRQAGRMIHVSNLFFHDYQAELARKLARISGLDRAFFSNSGAEAWEGALKLARARAGSRRRRGRAAWRILALEGSFHGRTFGALATTGQRKYQKPFAPLVPGVRFVRFNDVRDLKRKFDSSVCAIGLEMIQGEGGIRPLSREFVRTARRLSRRYGALLIADEIQSGLGRTGRWFAYQHYGIRPDVVTVAKPLAAGLPLGAILTTDSVARAMHPGLHGTTFGGGPLACAVAITVLETLERGGFLRRTRTVGGYLRQELERLKKKHSCIREIRGLGLMLGLELDSAELAKQTVRRMLERGIIINRTHETVLRLLPPYLIAKQHVRQLVRNLDRTLSEGSGRSR